MLKAEASLGLISEVTDKLLPKIWLLVTVNWPVRCSTPVAYETRALMYKYQQARRISVYFKQEFDIRYYL